MKNSNKGYFYYLLWTAGALVLIYYGHKFTVMMDQKTGTFYDLKYSLIGDIVYAFAFGLYMSLLNGLPSRRVFNRPLFFSVFLPSLLLLIYPLFTVYVKQIHIWRYHELIGGPQLFFFGLVSGLALMKSLFSSK